MPDIDTADTYFRCPECLKGRPPENAGYSVLVLLLFTRSPDIGTGSHDKIDKMVDLNLGSMGPS